MTDNIELLKQKVDERYAKYKAQWLQMQPAQLIENCEEIEAITRMAKTLPNSTTDEEAEYLLRFKDPLKVVSDMWIVNNGMGSMVMDHEMDHILWKIMDTRDAESDYEMEPEFYDEGSQTPKLSM